MTTTLILPAYGRKYTSTQDALADWRSGKDFKLFGSGGVYINNQDAQGWPDGDNLVIKINTGETLQVN